MELGADIDYMDHAWWVPSTLLPDAEQSQALFVERALPSSIMVTSAGKRFCNETEPYNDIGYDMYGADKEEGVTAAPCWFVFDATFRHRFPCGLLLPGYTAPDSRLPKELKKMTIISKKNPSLHWLRKFVSIKKG